MYMKITPSMTTNHELVEDAMVKVSDLWSRLSHLLLFTVWFQGALGVVLRDQTWLFDDTHWGAFHMYSADLVVLGLSSKVD